MFFEKSLHQQWFASKDLIVGLLILKFISKEVRNCKIFGTVR